MRHGLTPHDGGCTDDDRRDGAPADVGVPPPEDRRRVGEVVDPLGCGVDQRCDDAEVQMRHGERRNHQEHADGDRHRLPATDPHARQPISCLSREQTHNRTRHASVMPFRVPQLAKAIRTVRSITA